MAVYKVIQDIEAEDKLLGPLSLKGLVYAGIAVICGFINVKLLQSGMPGFLKASFIFVFFWPMLLFGVLASPLGRDQPTEVWLLSRLRFFLKPRLRIWDQSGIVELVTVTAPKKIARQLTKGLTQSEVNSRLQALAATLDSRGWAVKNVNVNLTSDPGYFGAAADTDRLVGADNVIREVPAINVHAADDILDTDNPTAQKFQAMMAESEARRKAALAERVANRKSQQQRQEEAFEASHGMHDEKIHDTRPLFEHHRPAAHPASKSHQKKADEAAANRVTRAAQAAKLELAQSGNDLSVAAIASLASHNSGPEVSVSLH